MRRFEWNALRQGDHVVVHDDRDGHFELLDGEVVIVQSEPGLNDVAVRVTHGTPGDSEVLRPRRAAVHLVPILRDDTCWRCTLGAAA